VRAARPGDAVQVGSSGPPQLPLFDVRPAAHGGRSCARARAPRRLELAGDAAKVVALVGVVLVAVVVVALAVLVLDLLVLVVLLLHPLVALAIVEQLGAPRRGVALELAQPEHVHAALLALVARAEQQDPVLLDYVQLLYLHGLVEDQPVRHSVWKARERER